MVLDSKGGLTNRNYSIAEAVRLDTTVYSKCRYRVAIAEATVAGVG